MVKIQSKIEFINHASVLVSYENIGILSDPWFSGDAFHKGWNLLHETPDSEVIKLLHRVTHIWISHEHPDHFSIKFFKTHAEIIKKKRIEILFQKTKDRRVVSFLKAQKFKIIELGFDLKHQISENITITCIKDGFYDAGLLIQNGEEKILNLNDCEVTTPERAKEVKKVTGEVDVLLTQFSFAAWKGGQKNKKWRQDAANEKLQTMKLQIDTYKPKAVIPFASFIYFSNTLNYYLNDAVNTPASISKYFKSSDFLLCLMKPYDIVGGETAKINNQSAIDFWNSRYEAIDEESLNRYESVSNESLGEAFKDYCARINNKNNQKLMRFIRWISPIKAFQPVEIFLIDRDTTVHFDYLNGKIKFAEQNQPLLFMHSESLHFMFKNSFGFDTLTVNGCFEEAPRGFVAATKTLAIENLNNLGIFINVKTIFNFSILKLFLTRLYRVAKKLEN
jgi:hypothetical protein